MFENIPNVKLGLIAVSRDCFPRPLSEMRRANIAKACEGGVYECPVTVENEADMLKAVADVKAADCNALVVFLGNFGPETPETLIAKYFEGPCMFVAAAEGDGDLINGRGDAYCGMLNCSYNLGMRHLKGYIPEYPVGTADDIAKMIADFIPIARAVIGVKNLKIITFGPRPQDFFACNAPIKGLYELGVEIEENSELDLLVSYKAHAGDARIPAVCEDMKKEMGEGRYYADMLERMAQFELTLLDWAEGHKGARKYVAFADKCWPAFPEQFGFEPCYVNSRLASRGIPVACEVDIYGALSEYIGACISHDAVTLLDINNSVPASLYEAEIKGKFDYTLTDTFMGFHCGNTPSCKLCADRAVKYQLIQHRLLEPAGSEPDFTRGTLEADIVRLADRVAYINHDLDDAMRGGIVQPEDVPAIVRERVGERNSVRINSILTDIIAHSGDGALKMSPEMQEAVDVFTDFMYQGVYYNPIAKGEERKVQNILGSIWEYYVNHIAELPAVYQSIADDEGPQRAVCDYVSGMTDSYALEVYSELFIPAAWTIK